MDTFALYAELGTPEADQARAHLDVIRYGQDWWSVPRYLFKGHPLKTASA